MIPNNQLEEWQKGYSTLKQENAALRVEIVKQCRLNGMGAERELKLITQNKDLKGALKVTHEILNYIAEKRGFTRFADCCVEKICHINTESGSCSFQTGVCYGNCDRAADADEALSSPEVKRALEYLE